MTGTPDRPTLDRPTLDRPGFDDPVDDAQACFRAVLDAISRPGLVQAVPARLDPPPPLHPATAAVLLTLLDSDTPLHLDPALDGARGWIAFHCGAPPVAPDRAAFSAGLALPPLGSLPVGSLPVGSDDAPQDGATAIVQVPSLEGGPALRLTGPGVDGSVTFRPTGLPADFIARWAANHALVPRGVDLILCAGTRLAALPRSVRVEAA